ncbi:alpha-soluble NSF attachment protein-like [Biomphalaria glabrata]|uniref:Alpha-soluble NSF attachment protein-like n=1 Tax=Biomphalaria glabrata TaxID=6526 RepID=A0A9W2ZZF1_BIOGL|nr:alpha-soluble NSF attachment protein-like [Biomphalaria glabrata]
MADQEQKALQLIAEAEKKLKSSKGLFNSLFGGGGSKQEEACDLYVRAANAFKMAKKWPQAGKAFEEAALLQIALGSKHEGATHYVEAGNCYRKADANAAVSAIHKAIEIYTDMGRFNIAAKHHITVAEIYENELSDMEKAVQNYEQAADYYKGEESNSSANKCLLKVAQFSATLENYEKAIEIYEQVAVSSMDNSLLKYSAKDHFFRASICHMCMDTANATLAVKKYEEMFPAFADSRECKLVKKLLEAIEAENVDQFTEVLKEYDSISRLDPFLTTLLVRVKKQLSAEPDLC